MPHISHVVLALKVSTVQALLTDTLVSGQLLLRPPSENPVFLNSFTNSAFLHSRKRPVTVTKILSVSRAYPLTSYKSFHCQFNFQSSPAAQMAAKKEIRREGLGQDDLCQRSCLSLRNIKKCQMFSKNTNISGLWPFFSVRKTVVQY